MKTAKNVGLWLATLAPAATFLMAGTAKVSGVPRMIETFHRFGYPDWFRVIIGVTEIAGAIALLFPLTATLAAITLGGIMVGATATHLQAGEALAALVPLTLLVLVGLVGHARRPRWLVDLATASLIDGAERGRLT